MFTTESFLPSLLSRRMRRNGGFSLVELMTVIAVISIMAAASASLIPSALQANQINSHISNVAALMEEARETAISSNTYVYVLFSNTLPGASLNGAAVYVVESGDGTDTLTNFTVTSLTGLLTVHKIQTMPGIQVTDSGVITGVAPAITTPASAVPASMATLPATYTAKVGSVTYTFTRGIMFKPDGEAIASSTPAAWKDVVEFGVQPIHQSTRDVAVIRLTRLTGKLTVYRQ